MGKFLPTHGQTETRLYYIWTSMKARCFNQNNHSFKYYGNRGITVCEEWKQSFESFAAWANANGYSDTLTLDRLDNNKGYSPDNCRWADRTAQSRNRRNNRLLTYKGETKTFGEWAEITGIKNEVLWKRLLIYGWSVEKAFTTPVKEHKKTEYRFYFEFNNKRQTLLEWAKETGIKPHTLYCRICCQGWSIEKALTKPPQKSKEGTDKHG